MDQVYALGITCIQFVQYWFKDWDEYFMFVNHVSNPHYILHYLFPAITIFDSVFGSQLLVVMAFGGWLNSVLKWVFFEDRPYWWVRETTFYTELGVPEPKLLQTEQTCETGPGSPSGHSATAASIIILFIMWISHILNDRKWNIWWWAYCVYPIFGTALVSVVLARMFVATHFPHQCVLGALIGTFVAPMLCIYLTDPFIWQYGTHKNTSVSKTVYWHIFFALVTMAISVITYFGLKLFNIEPFYTVNLAFRWCTDAYKIRVTTTPMFSLVQAGAALLAAAICVTPAVAKYRHYSQNRSIIISIFATVITVYAFQRLEDDIPKENVSIFYGLHFLVNVVRPMVLLKVVPELAMWPYRQQKIKTQ